MKSNIERDVNSSECLSHLSTQILPNTIPTLPSKRAKTFTFPGLNVMKKYWLW